MNDDVVKKETCNTYLGKIAAESDNITYESIIKALRQSNTNEGYAVASLLKRGKIKLRIQYAHPRGYAGLYKFKTDYITIYTSVLKTPLSAAGFVTHETKHFLQNLTASKYAKIHEFEAYMWQRNVDKTFPLRLEQEIWDFLNSNPVYKNLK